MTEIRENEFNVVFMPSGRRGHFSKDTTVLAAAQILGVDLDSVCGGRGICGRCQFELTEGRFEKHGLTSADNHLSPRNRTEDAYDTRRGLGPDRRLGCQARLLGDALIDVPPESQRHRQVIRKRPDLRAIEIDPVLRLYYVQVEKPDLARPESDVARLASALQQQWQIPNVQVDPALLPQLQKVLRQGQWQVTAALRLDGDPDRPLLVALWPGLRERLFGMAVDVGSTTVAAHLTDLESGEVLASAGAMNPQIRFGEDLMSRVSHIMMHPEALPDMTTVIRRCITDLAADVCREAGLQPADILEVTLVGNPVMHHLLLGIDPIELGGAPLARAQGEAILMPARDLDIALHIGARAYILPCIAGHVGADCAAVALSEGPHRRDDLSLIVDVGTNAEILLGNRERLLAASSPTGPAFEGAQISSGQRAAPGAIERVRIDPNTLEPRFKVIGAECWSDEADFAQQTRRLEISGICGSGIIEVVGEMLLAGILSPDGVIAEVAGKPNGRIRPKGRTFSYHLHDGSPEISITQEDVRAIQLAKGALYAGARLLMDEMAVDQVDRVVLAGAFGSHIDPKYAMILGMIPDCPLAQVSSAGNAASTGARIALLNRAARLEIEDLVQRIEKVETAVAAKFQEHFVAAMAMPHASHPYPHLRAAVNFPTTSPDQTATPRRRRRRTKS